MAQIGTFTPAERWLQHRHHQDALANIKGALRPRRTLADEKAPDLRVLRATMSKSVRVEADVEREPPCITREARRSVLPGTDLRQPRRGR